MNKATCVTCMLFRFKILASTLLLILFFGSFKQPDKILNIVFIGDSITHGTMQKDQSPPIYAGEYLKQKGQWTTVNIYNSGISGFTTVDFLPVTNKAFRKVQTVADSLYQDKMATLVFSIMLGTNDSAIKGPTGAPVTPEQYRLNLKAITDSLTTQYPNCKIVYNYPIWYSNNTHNRGATYLQEGQSRVLLYRKEIDHLVESYHRTGNHQVFKGDTKAYQYFKENYLTDLKAENGLDGVFYLHPNKKGDIALGQLWAKAISKVLK